MPISNKALIALLASTLITTEAFVVAPSTGSSQVAKCSPFVAQPARSNRVFSMVTMSPVDDLIAADDDDDADEEAPDFIVSSSDLDSVEDDEEDGVMEFEPPVGFTYQLKLAEVREQFRRHDTDTGSPEYQVASMTERISYLTKHLQANPKDFSTRRGLVALVNKRRRMLNYLFKEDVERYKTLVDSLGIRHKAPGRVMSRAEKYAKYASKKKSKTRDSL
uniref:30S ribosomal protein S15 n=1 Tax=Leptocylindrus danicus TaxID=163516 RepID=A0A7S2PJX5_9STRA|mmetsp:Transcript_3868/g.5601  ORF Transcript_3868/g.5601 Transcript_3868/m.5601 type:complete len:220 (+) Transcript_3868:158-817(+)|eukprot:CAMPEP_0116027020 /NCGR_PEP_ID=MMETSP0321-20121206/14325_1 /TAXON_ID=163516 /ORGANISM="Leptocylindrus danicus var. danicus, Strain B650" /LENGTH=219 /DNA_ID=CAMNT_0003500185 /DNA_START=144 /DNA_END=803 /DNA_ORIENTATION=+